MQNSYVIRELRVRCQLLSDWFTALVRPPYCSAPECYISRGTDDYRRGDLDFRLAEGAAKSSKMSSKTNVVRDVMHPVISRVYRKELP